MMSDYEYRTFCGLCSTPLRGDENNTEQMEKEEAQEFIVAVGG